MIVCAYKLIVQLIGPYLFSLQASGRGGSALTRYDKDPIEHTNGPWSLVAGVESD